MHRRNAQLLNNRLTIYCTNNQPGPKRTLFVRHADVIVVDLNTRYQLGQYNRSERLYTFDKQQMQATALARSANHRRYVETDINLSPHKLPMYVRFLSHRFARPSRPVRFR